MNHRNMKPFYSLTALFFIVMTAFGQVDQSVTIDYQVIDGPLSRSMLRCVGAGRAHEGLRADWQAQLKLVKEECGFEYLRFHGIFHDDMGVYKEDKDGYPLYNWQYVDMLYDFLLSIDVKPFIELSFMPEELASGTQTVFWWKANVTPPKSYEKYQDLISAFVNHLTDRYGRAEVSSWYFEVWNEPNHGAFFSGSMDEYFQMYQIAAETIKSVEDSYRVGGPATAGPGWITELLDFCADNDVPIDFISTHEYGVLGFFDEFGNHQIQMVDPDRIVKSVRQVYDWVSASQFPDLEIHFTEWSSSYSPADPIHDTYQNASYVLNTLLKTRHIATSMSYWTFTDIFEEGGVPQRPFEGIFGLLNVHGIKKPTYQAFRYLNQLGDKALTLSHDNVIASRDEKGVQVLLWDFSLIRKDSVSNQVIYGEVISSDPARSVALDFIKLKSGLYTYQVFKTGYRHNDPYTSYLEMGAPQQLSKDQESFLRSVSDDQPLTSEIVEIRDGRLVKKLELSDNDVVFIKLSRI